MAICDLGYACLSAIDTSYDLNLAKLIFGELCEPHANRVLSAGGNGFLYWEHVTHVVKIHMKPRSELSDTSPFGFLGLLA